MLRSIASMMLLGAASLATGCSPTVPAVEGAGFVLTTPLPKTVTYMRRNDPEFGAQTAGNNRACQRAPACRKKGQD